VLHEQKRIGWDKAFRGYLRPHAKALHKVPNPYNKTPQSSAWVISTLTNLGTFSKAMWKNHCTKLHDSNSTSSPTSDLDADIAHCYANLKTLSPLTTSYSIALSRRSSNPNARTKPNFLAAYAAHIVAFLQSALNGSILYATSLTRQFPLLHALILSFVFHKLYS
jgi:hypothetical protein